MVRRVFFSFDYDRDIWRVNQVRNSGLTKEVSGFIDPSGWEGVKRAGDAAIERWINENLNGTTVTVVLIGAQTSNSRWVRYELQQSRGRGNGILGIKIHMLENQNKQTDIEGDITFLQGFRVYDWVLNDGYHYIDNWIETAASNAGR